MGLNIKTKAGAVQSSAKLTQPAKVEEPKKASESSAIAAALTKDKGQGLVVKGIEVPSVTRIATGTFEFDLATGGGFPRGRLSIIYGPESGGKTNKALRAVKVAQSLPPPCNKVVWVDLEHAFDPVWVAAHGINLADLIVVQPGYGEEAVDAIDALVRADDVALLVVDSVAAIVAAKEVNQSTEAFDVGTSALLIKRLTNKLVVALTQEERRGHKPAVIFINQTRFKIGVLFGNPETMPGGKAQLFAASLIVRLSGKNKIAKEVNPDMPAFKETDARIIKAKVPITASEFSYDMAMLPTDRLAVGETDSWTTVMNHLKAMGILKKADKGQGWECEGIKFKTLVDMQDTYYAEDEYARTLQGMVVEARRNQTFMVDPPVDQMLTQQQAEADEAPVPAP